MLAPPRQLLSSALAALAASSLLPTALGQSATDPASTSPGGAMPTTLPPSGNTTLPLPKNYGMIVFRAFEPLDVYGPLEALFTLAKIQQLSLYILAESMDPVTTEPLMAAMNPKNSSFFTAVQPTHTFANAPSDLEVLIVPGGLGSRSPNTAELIKFIADVYPSLRYLITICTGATFAAKAGVLDGKRATTNKASWASTIVNGPNTTWVSHARWVVDGNIWTSSGISAGIDATLGFISEVYGAGNATLVAKQMEYEWHSNSSWDPFADMYNLTDSVAFR